MLHKVLIFTDLDGSLLHRDNFKFDVIKGYIKNLVSEGILIIPNTSKTEKEILDFNKELGINLPFILESGAAIKKLNLINSNLPEELILSKEKETLLNIFKDIVPLDLQEKCKWLSKMDEKKQTDIFGLRGEKLKNALDRKYTVPFIFIGNKYEKNQLIKILKRKNLFLQEGGRVINLTDKTNKAKALQVFVRFFKENNKKVVTIAVGDNYNDLDMLRKSDYPCLVFNDRFKLDKIPIENLIITNKPSPEGWSDVIKMALAKLGRNY